MFNQNSDDETTIISRRLPLRRPVQRNYISSGLFPEHSDTHQLAGSHFLDVLNGVLLGLGIGYGTSYRDEPDARRYVYSRDIETPNDPLHFQLDQSLATRFYSELKDNDYNFATNFSTRPLEINSF